MVNESPVCRLTLLAHSLLALSVVVAMFHQLHTADRVAALLLPKPGLSIVNPSTQPLLARPLDSSARANPTASSAATHRGRAGHP